MPSRAAAIAAAADSVGGLDRADVTRHLQRTFASPRYQPPMLPQVAVEVMQLSQRPSVQFEQVVKVLQRDAVLAARVLSLAQSAAYAGRSPVLTLQQAAVRLGLTSLREVVLQAALHLKVFRVPGYEPAMERLALHASAVAHVMRAVCRRTSVETEYAFLCGLIHDVGFAASLLALSDDPAWRTARFEDVASVLDDVHEEASGLLARLWNLPEPIQRLVATHHEVSPGGRAEAVNATLIVAEQLAWEAGAGLEPPPEGADPLGMATPEPPSDGIDVNWTGLVEEARRVLGLDDLGLAAARAEAFQLVRGLTAPPPPRSGGALGPGAHRR
jgi:HD-like signal output (HDOD) protein